MKPTNTLVSMCSPSSTHETNKYTVLYEQFNTLNSVYEVKWKSYDFKTNILLPNMVVAKMFSRI